MEMKAQQKLKVEKPKTEYKTRDKEIVFLERVESHIDEAG